jgi:hypothetical protein
MYHVVTGNYLPRFKKLVETEIEAIEIIKQMIDKKDSWVTNEQVHISYRIIKIDGRQFNGKNKTYKNVFLKMENVLPVAFDYKMEKFRPKALRTPKKQVLT